MTIRSLLRVLKECVHRLWIHLVTVKFLEFIYVGGEEVDILVVFAHELLVFALILSLP